MSEERQEVNEQSAQQPEQQAPQQSEVQRAVSDPLFGLGDDNMPSRQQAREQEQQQQLDPTSGEGDREAASEGIVKDKLSGQQEETSTLSAEQNNAESATEEKPQGSESESSLKVESPLGEKVFGNPEQKQPALEIENYEDVNKAFSEKYGLSLEDAVSYKSKYEEVNTKASQYEAEKNQILDSLNKLPEDLRAAITEAEKGGDYRAVLNSRPNLDYNKSADDMGDSLLQAYFSDISEEDLERANPESEDYDEGIAKWVNDRRAQAKEKFESDKNLYKRQMEDAQKQQQEFVQKFESSLDSAVPKLKEAFPSVGDNVVNELKEDISGTGIRDMFFNEDGTVSQEGMMRLALAKYGMDHIKQLEAKLQEKFESKGIEKAISKSDDNIHRTHGQKQNNNLSKELEAKRAAIRSLAGSSTY